MTKALTIAQSVQDAISNDILTGRLAPDAWLRLAALQESYGVSLSPLREAMANLVGRGLVIQEGQRGFRIAPVALADLDDLCETRCRIEGLAFSLAIASGDTDWEAQILAAHHKLRRHPRTRDKLIDEEWETLHRDFHLSLIRACGSERLLGFCHQLYDQFDRYRRLAVLSADRHPMFPDRHEEKLVEAALDRDSARGDALLRAHIQSSADQVREMMAPHWREAATEPARRPRAAAGTGLAEEGAKRDVQRVR